jgi:phage-related minor tail protein
MTEERRVQLVAEVDTTRTRAGFQEIGQQAGQMAQQVTQAGERAERAVSAVGSGGATASRNVDGAARSIVGSIQRTTAAMEAGGRQTAAYYEAIGRQRGIDPNVLRPYLEQLRVVEAAQARTREGMGAGAPGVDQMGVSAAQTSAALRQLPAQMTDIVTQLAGGQNPFTILIQQGGQIKDSFGGAGNAINAIGGEVKSFFMSLLGGAESANAVSGAVSQIAEQQQSAAQSAEQLASGAGEAAGAANSLAEAGGNVRSALTGWQIANGVLVAGAGLAVAAAGALAYAHYKGTLEAGAYARSLILSGNAAGATVDQLSDAARRIAAINGSGSAAMDAVTSLASTGQVSAEKLQEYGTLAVDVQKIVGRSIKDTADEFSELGKTPLAALDKIHEKYGFVTAATYLQVKALQDQGKASEAADVAQQAYADGIANQRQKVLESLTDWERGWLRIKGAASGALDAVLDFAGGREDTNAQKINTLLAAREGIEARIARLKAQGAARDGGRYDESKDSNVLAAQAELAANERSINVIRDKDKAQRDAAKAKADEQKVDDAKKQWANDADKFLGRVAQRDREITVAIQQGKDAHLDSKVVEERLAEIRKKYADTYNVGIESNIAALKRRDQIADAQAQREIARIAAQRALGVISEGEAINKTAKVDLTNFDRDIAAKQNELSLISQKVSATSEQKANDLKDKEAEIESLREQRAAREEKRQNDLAALEQKRAQDTDDLYNKGIAGATAERDSLLATLSVQLDYNQQVGLTKSQVAEVKAEHLLRAAALKEEIAATQEAIPGGEKLAAIYREQAQALRDSASATIGGAARESAKELQDFLDPARAESFGDALRNAFGSAGDSLTRLTGALKEYGSRQAKINEQREAADWRYNNGKEGEEQYLKNIAALNERSMQTQLAGYGDMAGAAASFFGEHSRGYQSLMAVSQVFHAAELAMTMAELVPKAISAVLTQGQGDPYTAFGRMAAMGALVAGLGVAIGGVGGGGADTTAKDRQKAQGAGSILGDKDAKSESISKSLDLIEKNTYQDLTINSSMLASLRNIESSVASFANQLVRSTDITNPSIGLNTNNGLATTVASAGLTAGGAAIGGMAGAGLSAFTAAGAIGGPIGMIAGTVLGYLASQSSFVGKIATSIFGGKQSVQDSGFTMDAASLASILSSGAKAEQYADIKTSGGWFRSDKNSAQTTPLGEDANRQFTAIITSMAGSITAAGGVLGLSGDDFTNKLNSFVVDIGKVSLKDLKGDELQKAIESVFAKLGDDMAQSAVGGLAQFQDVGEGYLETLARIATEYQTVDVVLQSFGKTFGQVGMESIAARDRLVDLAGGLEKFTSQGEYFLTNFFSDQEQAAALKKRIDPTLAKYGLSSDGDAASQVFRDFVVGLDLTKEASAQAYSELMLIAPALKKIVDANKDAADTSKESAEKARGEHNDLLNLQAQTYELLGDKVGAATVLEKQRVIALESLSPAMAAATKELWAAQAAADAISKAQSNASSLMNSVDGAFSALQSVVAREKTAIQSSIDVHTKSVTKLQSLSDSLHSTLDSLQTPDQKLADRALGQAQIRAALAIAKAGGPLPEADSLKKALSAVTQDASSQFGSYTDYLRDLYQTQNDVASLAGITDSSLSVEEKSLEALNSQVKQLDTMVSAAQAQLDVLKGASVTLLSIEQAFNGFSLALAGAQKNPINAATAGITNVYQVTLGRTPDAAGMEYWTGKAAAGESLSNIVRDITGSMEAQVQAAYKELLGGRAADTAGLNYWLGTGQSIDAIRAQIMQSDEYEKLHNVPGFAAGGMFGGGLRIVGENGPELEATGPARIWSSNQTAALLARAAGGGGGGESAALAAAVQRLTREVEGLRAEARATAGHTEKTSRLLNRVIRQDKLVVGTEEDA